MGICPSCRILPVRAAGACGGYITDLANAIVWAVGGTIYGIPSNQNPAKILSISSGAPYGCPNFLQSAVTRAHEAGAIIAASSGNNGGSDPVTPANCKHVISVGALSRIGTIATYGARNAKMYIPG